MQIRQHLRECAPVAVSLQVELLEKDEIRAVVEDARNAHHSAERLQAVQLGAGRRALLAETLTQTPGGYSRG